MLGISFYLLILSFDSHLGRLEGATLFGGIIIYTFFNYRIATRTNKTEAAERVAASRSGGEDVDDIASGYTQVVLIIVGIIGVVAGAQIVVDSAVKIMCLLGVSEKFIGLTIVAFGTSLPEVATSVVAALKKEMDISLGNIVGSNVFNILSVLGSASLLRPIPIPGGFFDSGLVIDYSVMLFLSFLPWLMMRKTFTVTRKGGLVLLFCYTGYLIHLMLKA
jgi:cation:H+ antiporter